MSLTNDEILELCNKSQNVVPLLPFFVPQLLDNIIKYVPKEKGNLRNLVSLFFHQPTPTENARPTSREPYSYLTYKSLAVLINMLSDCSSGSEIATSSNDIVEELRLTIPSNKNKQPKRLKQMVELIYSAHKESNLAEWVLLFFAHTKILSKEDLDQFINLCYLTREPIKNELLFKEACSNLGLQLLPHTDIPRNLLYRDKVSVCFEDSQKITISDCCETVIRFLVDLIQWAHKKEPKCAAFSSELIKFFDLVESEKTRSSEKIHSEWATLISCIAAREQQFGYKQEKNSPACPVFPKGASFTERLNNLALMIRLLLNQETSKNKVVSIKDAVAELETTMNLVLSKKFFTLTPREFLKDSAQCEVTITVASDNNESHAFLLSLLPIHIWITSLPKERVSNEAHVRLANKLLQQVLLEPQNRLASVLNMIYAAHLDYSLVSPEFYHWYDFLLLSRNLHVDLSAVNELTCLLKASHLDHYMVMQGPVFQNIARQLTNPFAISLFLKFLKDKNLLNSNISLYKILYALYDKLEEEQQGAFQSDFISVPEC